MESTSWHGYPKIYALGHRALAPLFEGPVVVEEKADGSQFSFGKFNDEYRCRSKGKQIEPHAPEKLFKLAVDNTMGLPLHEGWTYRGEVLSKPKHNTLAYARVPEKNVVVYDINDGHESYLSREDKEAECERLGLECIQLLASGELTPTMEDFDKWLETSSMLGGQLIEGVVVKNYAQFGADGKAIIGKYVSERFKEIHNARWKEANPAAKDVILRLTMTFKTEARWDKAIQHLREAGELEDDPRDIGKLIPEINKDVKAECEEEVKDILFKWAWPKVKGSLVKGFPEYYKELLLKKQIAGE